MEPMEVEETVSAWITDLVRDHGPAVVHVSATCYPAIGKQAPGEIQRPAAGMESWTMDATIYFLDVDDVERVIARVVQAIEEAAQSRPRIGDRSLSLEWRGSDEPDKRPRVNSEYPWAVDVRLGGHVMA